MLDLIDLIVFIMIVVLSNQQSVQELSQCIGNCMYCDPIIPTTCMDPNYTYLGEKDCMPFYKGSNCQQQSYGYENIVQENGTFSSWSINKTQNCQLVIKNEYEVWVVVDNMNYNGLGVLRNGETLSRSVEVVDKQATNRVVIKFSVAVDGPQMESYFTESIQSTTTNKSSSSTNTSSIDATNIAQKQWMTITLMDPTFTNNQSLLSTKNISMSNLSSVRTTCGYIYSYQFAFDLDQQYSQFAVNFSVFNSLNLTWVLLNFDFSLGCRAYLVSSGNSSSYHCDSCISGYYPKYAANNQVEECKACDYRCVVCVNWTTCLTCIQNTQLNQKTGMCQFSQFFKTLGMYQIVTGMPLDVGSLLGSMLVKSQSGVIELSQPLSNNQPFTVSLLLFYSAAFRNSGQNLMIFINDQNFTINTTNLPLDVSTTISNLSNLTSQIYQNKLIFNGTANSLFATNPTNSTNSTNTTNMTNDTSNANVSSSFIVGVGQIYQNATIIFQGVVASGDEFGVAGVNVEQFQCAANCDSCTYSPYTQTSQCIKCSYFFDLATNCLTCANGYYIASSDATDQCVKCYSTCKQCTGSSISDCLSCFDGFQLGPITYDYQCIACIYKSQFYNITTITQCNNASYCQINNPLRNVIINTNCQQCLNSGQDQLTTSSICLSCWLAQNLAKSTCQPVSGLGYQYYGSDISQGVISSQWISNMDLVRKDLTSFYTNLYGVDWQSSGNQSTTLTFIQPLLPLHRGLTIFFTLFKVNSWTDTSSNDINIVIRSQDQYIITNSTINVSPSHGYNIYGDPNSGPEMMYTFVGNYQQHSYTGQLQLIITASHTGIFLQNMEVYLGNCNDCNGNRLTYQVYYIPTSSISDTQTGIDVWLTFNQGVSFVANDEDTQNKIINSFQFSIDQLGYQNLIPFTIEQNQLNTWNFVKYFLPIQGTLVNATLRVNNSMGNSIYSQVSQSQSSLENLFAYSQSYNQRLLLNERMQSINVQQLIHRYEDLSTDQKSSMSQLGSFYEFFQWFTLLTMILCAFFGIGIIFQEFSILLQLLFLHIYVSTNLLPASFKQPLSQMQKMQNLNFFAYPHAWHIQQSWFKNVNQNSPYPFTQYNVDVYFARSFYPTIIIDLIYLFWFVLLMLCNKFLRLFKNSSKKIIKFLRDIPQRPLNYIDQIWRYQFITTMWASFLQFSNFDGSTGEMRVNLALCVFSFITSLAWPIFVMIYTYHQHFVINVEHFLYLYNDIYYRKISSIAQKTRYYMYIGVRFGRYFLYVLFIAALIYQSTIGPVILMAINFLEVVYIIKFKIFRDKICLLFKLIENIGFIILEIFLLIIYGFSDGTITSSGFISIGYGVGTLYILMMINGVIRMLYLGYKKIRDILKSRYDYGERGEMQNFDNIKHINIELPTTQRKLY